MKLETALGLSSIISTAIITYIGYQQYKSNVRSEKLEESKYLKDLFEKRIAVFKATQSLLISIIQKSTCSMEEIYDFTLHAQESYFLFDDDIYSYLMNIRKLAIELSVMSKAMTNATDQVRRVEYSERSNIALQTLLEKHSNDELFEKFKKHLRISPPL